MARKRKASPKNSGPGIYKIYVEDKYAGRMLFALNEAAAIERWKLENPSDREKKVTAIKVKNTPLHGDPDEYARQLEQIEQQTKQAVQKHKDSFPKD